MVEELLQTQTHLVQDLDRDQLAQLLYKMQLTRTFEESAYQQYTLGKVHGTMHLYAGEEAVGIGAIAPLRPDDIIVSTHRGHAHAVGKGQDVRTMMAELLAKETGICHGRGGSMHMADVSLGSLGANGVVGGGLPMSVGAGLSMKMQGTGNVVVCFFGDGASNEGAFHEALNMSSVWKLPVVYVCENNQYGMSTSVARANAAANIADRALGYSMPGETVDGMDVLAVYEAVQRAAAHARSGEGPTLLNCITYRYYGHSKSDRQLYRTKEEVQAWRQRDPIDRFAAWLVAHGYMTQEEVDASAAQAQDDIDAAIAFGDASPEPSVEHLCDDVYAEEPAVLADPLHTVPAWARTTFGPKATVNPPAGSREISYSEALREGMSQALESDPKVYMLGEDIGVYGGAFGVSDGMVDRFGAERVRDTPISENTIVGCAIGSAVTGMRPIAEIQFMDFMTLAMEQTVLQGAKLRYMFGGRAQVPMVVRMPAGSGTGAAAQHSESLESWFVNVPGLKVVAPSTAYDAKGLLLAAIADNNPVMFVEHKLCYKMKGPVPTDPYIIPLGVADIKRRGKHLTVVASGIMVHRALEAAGKLSAEGIELEVVDMRSLKPYDAATVCESVTHTGRLIVVHEAPLVGGWGGEIVGAVAQSSAFSYLEAPIVRLGGADVPIPYNRNLERAAVPQTEDIVSAARKLVKAQI